jgi:hypothetical protein
MQSKPDFKRSRTVQDGRQTGLNDKMHFNCFQLARREKRERKLVIDVIGNARRVSGSIPNVVAEVTARHVNGSRQMH